MLDHARYGDAPLRLAAPGPCVGGHLIASIRIPPSSALVKRIGVDLICNEITLTTVKSGRGAGSVRQQEEAVWTGRSEFRVIAGLANIQMAIPCGLTASTPEIKFSISSSDYPQYRWKLRITADVPGVDLDRTRNSGHLRQFLPLSQ